MNRLLLIALLAGALLAPPAGANILVGQTGPNFTKTQVDGGPVSLGSYAGKVVVLFLLGYA